MNMSLFTFLKLCALLNLVSQSDTLRVGSWNFNSFGITKLSNDEARTTVVQVMRRYDVIFIQQIRDENQDVLQDLQNRLNTSNQLWNFTVSERLGDMIRKPQYAYYYRMENLTLLESYQYDDVNNTFKWPPYGALFHSSETGDLQRVGLLGFKLYKPAITKEINALASVVEDAKKTWNIQDILLMGDFKACYYLSKKVFSDIPLVSDKSYNWLVNDSFDTFTKITTNCAADRMIATGDLLNQLIDDSSVQVFRFDEYYNLNSTQTEEITPRYPVEVIIMKSSPQSYATTTIRLMSSVSPVVKETTTEVTDSTNVNRLSSDSVYNGETTTKSGGTKTWVSKISMLAIVLLLKMVI